MKTVLLALSILVSCSGCAGLAYSARDTVDCYLPRAGVIKPGGAAQVTTEFMECRATVVLRSQHEACMYLKGYEIGQCYADNNEPAGRYTK